MSFRFCQYVFSEFRNHFFLTGKLPGALLKKNRIFGIIWYPFPLKHCYQNEGDAL